MPVLPPVMRTMVLLVVVVDDSLIDILNWKGVDQG